MRVDWLRLDPESPLDLLSSVDEQHQVLLQLMPHRRQAFAVTEKHFRSERD
jgi:hypothetical protein